MANCKIDRGSTFDCDAVVQAGIKDYLYLINKEDFDNAQTLTEDGTSHEIIVLLLASGTQGYKFEAPKGSVQITPSTPFRAATANDGNDHQIIVHAHDVSQLSRENIIQLKYNKVVAIIPLADGRFELYGRNVGMRISDLVMNPGDADLGGVIMFTLKTPDNDPPEIELPHLIADSYDITELDSPAA